MNNSKTLLIFTILFFGIFGLANSSEAANYYIVEGGSGNGTAWNNAWDDINNISGIVSGDTIYIAAGSYTGNYTANSSGWTLKRATTAFHGSDTGWNNGYDGIVTFNGGSGATIFTLSNQNNIEIDGVDKTKFILNGNSSANYGVFGNGLSTHSIRIHNITAHHFLNTGINFGLSSGFGNNVEIANCELYKNGDGVSHETDGSIILLYATNIGQGRNKVHDNSIHDGCITANLAACDLMTGNINHTDIYNNHFNSGWTTTNSSDMTQINGVYNNIYNNIYETTGNNQNIFIFTNWNSTAYPHHNYIYNNLFYKPSSDLGNGAISFMAYAGGQISNIYIYNNTFYGHRWSVYLNKDGSVTYTNIVLKNNIFWPNAVQHRHIMDNAVVFESGQLILDHNFYYTGDSSTVLYKGYGNLTVAGLQALGSELHGGEGDPQFDSTSSSNGFHLTNNSPSPVKDEGLSLSSVFTTDKDNVSRPQGSAWDIGAYEYLSSTPPPPSATSTYEAESCSLIAPMQIVSDSSASGGQYIQTSTSESGTAICSFSVSQADTYKITARVFAPNGGTDSFYFQIDNSPEDTYDLNPTASPSEYNVWREDNLAKRGTGTFDNPQYDPYTINLSSGVHTLALRGRESNARLDYFYLTRVADITPPSAPSGLVVQ